MYKRARSNSFSDYNVVSYQSQPMDYSVGRSRKSRPLLPYKRKAGQKTALSKKIDSAISRRLENKVHVDYSSNINVTLAGLTLAPVTRYLLPQLAQGLGQASRIGNEIKIRSGILTVALNTNQFGATATGLPSNVRVMVVSSKTVNGITLATADFNNFWQIGNTDADFQGNMLDMLFEINKDQWTVYFDKVCKLGMTSGSNVNNNAYDNSHMQQIFTIDWGKYFKSSIKYEDTGTAPQNRNLFLVLQWCRADGGAMTQGDVGAELHYTNIIKYEDA